jgi:hypothetical protein
MKSSTARKLVAVGLLAGSAAAHAATTVLFTDNFNGYPYALGATSVGSSWATMSHFSPPTAGGGVDLIGATTTGTAYDFYPGNGGYVDLDGTAPAKGPTYFYASAMVPMSIGAAPQYRFDLTFDVGQNPNGTDRQLVPVIAGAAPGASIFTTAGMPLTTYTRTITGTWALGNPIQFGFWTPSSDQQGPIIDNVTLTVTPVPEPHEWAMMLAGLGMVGVMAKRRRRSGQHP